SRPHRSAISPYTTLFRSPLNYHSGVRRLEGYRHALEQAGIPVDPSLIVEGNFTKRGGYEAAINLFSRAQPPTAIFAANDVSALRSEEHTSELQSRENLVC